MELWTRRGENLCWKQWPDALSGLASLLDGFSGQVLVWSEAPSLEKTQLAEMFRLIRTLARSEVDVIAASPHPTREWIEDGNGSRADHFWLVGHPNPRSTNQEEIGAAVCPALHAASERGVTVSVCGRHRDRLLRTKTDLNRWCLGDYRHCPHWQRDRDG